MAPRKSRDSKYPIRKKTAQPEPAVPDEDVSEEELVREETADSENEQASQISALKTTLDDAIAEFYEAHPLFYDKGNPDYKNKQKKTELLETFCRTLGTGNTGTLNFNIFSLFCYNI